LKLNFKIAFLFSLILVLSAGISLAQTDASKIAKIKLKGIYIYSFAKNVYWPQDYATGDFFIGVYGDNDLYTQLNNSYTDKLIGSQKIKIKFFNEIDQIKDCHLLFVSEEKMMDIGSVRKKISKQTLLVSEGENLVTTGSMINFIYVQSRLKFQVNKTKSEKNDLKIGQTLTKLAHSII
tara:strand:+ start:549 stop:1085 length:537 start_codon:yes stop_codon:yes gene_type:complete